jgi:hypothetical protein
MRTTSVAVDMILDDTKEREIRRHDHQRDDPCNSCHRCCQDGTTDSSTKCEEEGNKRETAGNWVEDHDTRESLGGVFRCGGESGVIDTSHDVCGVIANDFWEAQILIGLDWRNIENAVAECAKCDGGVADIGEVGEHYLQYRNVTNDWRRDRGDEQQNRRGEEEESAKVVKDSGLMHLDCFEVVFLISCVLLFVFDEKAQRLRALKNLIAWDALWILRVNIKNKFENGMTQVLFKNFSYSHGGVLF